jgi:catechol 2,3-dioxygenase-like lactoylglutathione lyase family enzyme
MCDDAPTMDVRRQLQPDLAVTAFGSRGVTVARLSQSRAATLLRISAGGLLGRHRAPVDQVVLVIGGAGWAAGPEEVPEPVVVGDVVRWSAGELHAAGSERGLTLLAHEAPALSLGALDDPAAPPAPAGAVGRPRSAPLVATRVARVTADLAAARAFYAEGIGLPVVTTFEDHEGWSGVILGLPDARHQLELTAHRTHAPVVGGPDDLLVLTLADRTAVAEILDRLGRPEGVLPANPWWHARARTVLDPDGQRVALAWD